MNDNQNQENKEKSKDFEDDGRTIADMKDIDGASPNLFGLLNFRADKKIKLPKEFDTDKTPPEFIPLTEKERRAMVKAAWLLGLKVAIMGTAILVGLFLIMHVIVYFWSR